MTVDPRPLHLHTLDSLCNDLLSGCSIGIGKSGDTFSLPSASARGALFWYAKNRNRWASNVQTVDVEAIVDSANRPITLPPSSVHPDPVSHQANQYTLIAIRASQFAGLHHAGTAQSKPAEFKFDFKQGVTLFEGYNGSGKTSLLNAIIWALTGELLRPQRAPEHGGKDFEFEIGEVASHKLPPVAPLPDTAFEEPSASAVPVDTWVELEFGDQDTKSYRVRRSLRRGTRGVLKEEVSGLDALGLDPIGTRVGTAMPGVLPYVQVGTASSFGKAVSELTGMAPLVQLANHASKARKKIDGDLTKQRRIDVQDIDEAYQRTHADLVHLIQTHELPIEVVEIPPLSGARSVEIALDTLGGKLQLLKTSDLERVKAVLGHSFDVQDEAQRKNLTESIGPALDAVIRISPLPSMVRLSGLSKLTRAEAEPIEQIIASIRNEASQLVEIAAEPNKAARVRLYTRVAAWVKEHPALAHDNENCAVCGSDLTDLVDGVTGLSIKDHLSGAAKEGDYAGKTFRDWARHVIGDLTTLLPAPLAAEVRLAAVDGPASLFRQAIAEELFRDNAFAKSLDPLKVKLQDDCAEALKNFPAFAFIASPPIGSDRTEFKELNKLINRVESALAYPQWRVSAAATVSHFMRYAVGLCATDDRETVPESLLGQLLQLQSIVAAVAPIDEVIIKHSRLVADLGKRRAFEERLKEYAAASEGLEKCIAIGELAEQQVSQLQKKLQRSATYWRDKIYLSAFPSTRMDLVETRMSGAGEIQLLVGASGLSAPAQHVSNASALRASLLGFYLAYWQHMLKERGGLRLLLLDDPQELLDGDNRDRLADAAYEIYSANAQLIMTTHDTRFALSVARRMQGKSTPLNHQYVHPATARRGTLFLTPSIAKVQEALLRFNAEPDDAGFAQDYLSECRIFLEGRMGDLFDGSGYPAAATVNFAPTLGDHLNRLRGLLRSAPNELFKSPVMTSFVNDAAFKDGSPVLALLNKCHHRDKPSIRPIEVSDIKNDLERLRLGAEKAHEEFRNFNRRAPLSPAQLTFSPLLPALIPLISVPIVASLKAFVRGGAFGESQEVEYERITSEWFASKTFFYIRSASLGFSAPQGSIAIVSAEADAPTDRQLVIARYGKEVLARRLLKPKDSDYVALAAETSDPRRSPLTKLLKELEVSVHSIKGIFFGGLASAPTSKSEAVQVSAIPQLQNIQTAYRIQEDSAIPLALPGQLALGGPTIALDALDAHEDEYVALHLDDGTNLFKRVGARLAVPLQHMRQFESIGGLGVSDVLAVDRPQEGFRTVIHAVSVIGVLY
ncbi:ATP-binding protein [Pseudomonas syringae]|uniref:ATP-binding protein n=1 Tax=Pseudomonas syringae TaxID=317 RepID=UPI0013C3501D|nr:AAA family ATPase [Pseudomonas syringae]